MSAPTHPALANLQDIQLPEQIHQWPIAPGYWLALMAIIVIVLLIIRAWKRRQSKLAAKRSAIEALALINIDTPNLAIEINSLIKRAAMSYLGRDTIAKLEGQAWQEWLLQHQASQQLVTLLQRRYQAEAYTREQKQQLLSETQRWLSQALPLTMEANHV